MTHVPNLTIRPANEVACRDLQEVFGERGGWDEIHVGAEGMFAAAGMSVVSQPGKRRAVMRIAFA